MQSTFQAGVDAIYNAIVGQGVTPADKTPAQLVAAIGTVATNKYNAGYSAGYNANVAVGTLALSTTTVNVGEIWYIGRGVCGQGYVHSGSDTGYTHGTNPTCTWTLLESYGDGSNNTMVHKVQITWCRSYGYCKFMGN